ncbi:MAG: signal peptidase I [Bdellovibrio sp. CG10_big_fil_rev_8_21_14_0_10_47_8]|nr:MAG: signal peptidase I [Bdellovibrio sp. CG10_big_fil_rev_8_21_14_0_10_47_8]
MKKNLRGTWPQALVTFFGPIFLVVLIRWLVFEPFVIPSGSMIPTLLIHDHIFVNKLSYGVHVPFGKSFLWQWAGPTKGSVVVFRFPENPDVYYVKRVVATAGDEISVRHGDLRVNGKKISQTLLPVGSEEEDEFQYFSEVEGDSTHVVRYLNKEFSEFSKVKVPDQHFFVMGDNRDQSNDSRFWGFVPEKYLVGRASLIWLSCDETLESAQFICDPGTLRWSRLLQFIH